MNSNSDSKTKKLIIFGTGDFARIAYEYFTHDSSYEVVAFTVHQQFLRESTIENIPVIAFEDLERLYDPSQHEMHVAIIYHNLNQTRENIISQAKQKGYKMASYISSKAFVWRNCQIGEHVFIFEDNTVQPFVEIGNNVVLWSGNHIGHHSKIGNNCFISSHVVISGNCQIGDYCFLGVNSTITNNLQIGKKCWISNSATVGQDLPELSLVKSDGETKQLREEVLSKVLTKIARK